MYWRFALAYSAMKSALPYAISKSGAYRNLPRAGGAEGEAGSSQRLGGLGPPSVGARYRKRTKGMIHMYLD